MKILELEKNDHEEFDRLAKSYGSVFNTVEWTSLFNPSLKRFGFYGKGKNLKGGFIIYIQHKMGLRIYREPPFTPHIGPFLRVDAKNPAKRLSIMKKALSLMADFIDSQSAHVVSLSLSTDVIDTQPFIWRKYKVTPSYTYLIDLSNNSEGIFSNMSTERRNDINKGMRDGLVVRRISNMQYVKSLVLRTFSRQNKNISEEYLDKILTKFTRKDNSYAYVTFKDEEPLACSYCVYDKHKSYYLLGGYDYSLKHHGAGAIAAWESIKYAKKIGLRYFDFEGSMVPQIEKYFRGFGGQLTPYYRINKANLSLEIALKFFRREWF